MILVSLKHISKAFPGVRALDDVSFDVASGEIHVLMGENGAGKSTLMKILSGAYQPDSGSVEVEGKPVRIGDPTHAAELGIGMIYQELTVLPNLDVGRNIMLGREPVTLGGRIDWGRLYTEAAAALEDLDLKINPRAPLDSLSIGEQQMVEIARVAHRQPRIMIMDEPTSSLGKHEEETLFDLIRRLKARGVGIVYISHRMEEVFLLADRITVLRDGRLITTQPASELSRQRLITLMVGRDVEETRARAAVGSAQPVMLEAHGLSRGRRLKNVSLTLRAGEILGLAGLEGAGRTELARALFGVDPLDAGEILLDGQRVVLRSPHDAIAAGIAYVPEDRKGLGLVLMLSVLRNMALPSLDRLSSAGVLQGGRLRALGTEWSRRLTIRAASVNQDVEHLSGGNQQKVVLAKWLSRQPRVLILNEPTRGIDVGAKTEVHTLIREIAAQGVAVLMISSELPELLAMSDRIAVMWNGQMQGTLMIDEATEERVLSLAFGEGVAQA
jgi:ABC-type sugar transport system ATPase subunit